MSNDNKFLLPDGTCISPTNFDSCIEHSEHSECRKSLFDNIYPLISSMGPQLSSHFQNRFSDFINPSMTQFDPLLPVNATDLDSLIAVSKSGLNSPKPTIPFISSLAKKFEIPETVDNATLKDKFEDILKFVFEDIKTHTMDTVHPGFLSYIPNTCIPAAWLAKSLTNALNRFPSDPLNSLVLGELEHKMILYFCSLFGYDKKISGGCFTSGGSLSTSIGLFQARRCHSPNNMNVNKLRVYVSSETHFSGLKVASFVGFGFQNIVIVNHNEKFQISVKNLQSHILSDLASGLIPCAVICTFGSTNTGTIDDIEAVSKMLDTISFQELSPSQKRPFIHVDGAYGASFILAKTSVQSDPRLFNNFHLADSICIDHHKGFFYAPYGSSMVLVKDRQHLKHAFDVSLDSTSYLESKNSKHSHLYDEWTSAWAFSPELTRPARGLTQYLTLQLVGLKPFRVKMTENLEYTQWLYTNLLAAKFEILFKPITSVILFRINLEKEAQLITASDQCTFSSKDQDAFNTNITMLVNRIGHSFIYSVDLKQNQSSSAQKQKWIRLCILSGATDFPHIKNVFLSICEARTLLSSQLFSKSKSTD